MPQFGKGTGPSITSEQTCFIVRLLLGKILQSFFDVRHQAAVMRGQIFFQQLMIMDQKACGVGGIAAALDILYCLFKDKGVCHSGQRMRELKIFDAKAAFDCIAQSVDTS